MPIQYRNGGQCTCNYVVFLGGPHLISAEWKTYTIDFLANRRPEMIQHIHPARYTFLSMNKSREEAIKRYFPCKVSQKMVIVLVSL